MRIQYMYNNYPDSPRATEYSRSSAAMGVHGSMVLVFFSLVAVILFLIRTFSFFGDYKWGKFLGYVAFLLVMTFLDFYFYVIRPNNVLCETKIILLEDMYKNRGLSGAQRLCDSLRMENRKENIKLFTKFYPIALVSICDVIALIAGIKGFYYLCQKGKGQTLLIVSVFALCLFTYLIWRFIRKGVPKIKVNNITDIYRKIKSPAKANEDIEFCRKCGTRVLPDSIYCSKCGTKLR